MKLKFLDTIIKRIALSIATSLLIIGVAYLFFDDNMLNLRNLLILSVFIFIPVTLFYAIASTFFVLPDKRVTDDVLDD